MVLADFLIPAERFFRDNLCIAYTKAINPFVILRYVHVLDKNQPAAHLDNILTAKFTQHPIQTFARRR